MKAITPVIATVMLMLITVGTVSMSYAWFSNIMVAQTEKNIAIPIGGVQCVNNKISAIVTNAGADSNITDDDIVVADINGVNVRNSLFFGGFNTNGLVGYWRFEQSSGSPATNDSSGWGNMGTLTNMDTNLISNGDFETGSPPTGWNALGSATLSRVSSPVKTGSYAFKLVANGAPDNGAYQAIANPSSYAGKTLTLGVWYQASSANDKNARILLDDGVGYASSGSLIKDDAWHWLTVTRTISSSPTYLWPTFQVDYTDTDYNDVLYVDNAVLFDAASGPVAGRFGNALVFDGVNDYVDVPDSTSLRPTAITFGAWIKPSRLGSNIVVLAKRYSTIRSSYYAYTNGNLAGVRILNADGTTQHDATLSGVLTTDWHHLAGTYDGTTLRLFFDGVEKNSLPVSTTIPFAAQPLYLGTEYYSSALTGFFNGAIDEVMVWDRALSADEMTQLNKTNSGNFTLAPNKAVTLIKNYPVFAKGRYAVRIGTRNGVMERTVECM